MKGLLLVCVISLALYAQTLKVSSKSASPGERTTAVVSFDLPMGSDVLGLQWETTFSAQQMSIEGSGPEASDSAKAAGKVLRCAGKTAKELYSYTCILIGGQKQIESGPIAVFNFHISPKAQWGATPVRVGRAEAVTKDLRKIFLPDAEGKVTVKR
jgi:hypothetical protein